MASYAYDYLGRRISRTIYGSPNVTIRYAYDGDRIIAEYDGSGTLLRKFVYGPGVDEPICLIDVANGNAAYYYHFDGLGSVVALSDVNKVLVERYAYDVFGRPTIRDPNGAVLAESAWGNPYLFTGRAYEAESGLYCYRARYYDHATGRFLQPDPTGYSDGLNLYSYCGNNPFNFSDPSGLCKEFASGFGRRTLRNAVITVGIVIGIGVATAACPAVGAALIKVAPFLLAGAGLMGGAMLAPAITGYDYAGNDLTIYQRGEVVSDAGFLIGGSFYGAARIPSGAVTRPVGDLRAAGVRDAHHVIQDAAVRNLPGYDTLAAPGIQLPGPSTLRGSPHYRATQVQVPRGGGTYAAERRIGYKALRRSGYSETAARQAIQEADAYFRGIGVGPSTPTRIPGNRPGG